MDSHGAHPSMDPHGARGTRGSLGPHVPHALHGSSEEMDPHESNADALAPLVSAHWYLTDGDTDSKIT